MYFNIYQQESAETDMENGETANEKLMYYALGIAGESGELVDKIKKGVRNGWTPERLREEIIAEGGDVLWYLAGICRFMGIEMRELPQHNLQKLRDRKERGVIKSEGDNR